MDDMLIKFKEVVDEEIQAYELLGELYELKQSILIQGKTDSLWDIDAKIMAEADIIRAVSQKRKEVAKYLGNEDITLSEVIEKARASDEILAQKLQGQKTKINILSKSIALQEETNFELVKHGLTMVGKTIDIIVKAVLPEVQVGQYNKQGKSIKGDKSLISSIVEEA